MMKLQKLSPFQKMEENVTSLLHLCPLIISLRYHFTYLIHINIGLTRHHNTVFQGIDAVYITKINLGIIFTNAGTLCMLGKNFRKHFEIFFLILSENMELHTTVCRARNVKHYFYPLLIVFKKCALDVLNTYILETLRQQKGFH